MTDDTRIASTISIKRWIVLSRKILDSLTAEVAVLDQDGTIVAVNRAWQQFSEENGGSPESTGVGTNYLDVCRSAAGEGEELAEQVGQGIERVLKGDRDTFRIEYPCHGPKEQRWFLLYVSRLQGEESLVITTHIAITDRKQAELQLVEAERLAAIGQAMQGLSHEGRNALQRVQSHIGLLRLHMEHDHEALDLLQRIERAQDKLLELYEEVRTYAAPINLSRQRCQLQELVDRAWSASQPSSCEVRFVHLPATFPTDCHVDPAAMQQVLRMIYSNSTASRQQDLEIRVSWVEQTREGLPGLTLIISDNGPGVPEEDWCRVFEPFYTPRTQGTGLGLAISKRIVSAHDGSIELGRPLLGGTSVYISLPHNAAK
jgi:signal transduction histidine kinase